MTGLFKSIINIFNPKKQPDQKDEDGSKLYLDRIKKKSLQVKLGVNDSCQDIHINYHNEILGELIKNNTGGSFSKIINSNEFSFCIIDDDNPYLELKLKMRDQPYRFMKKKSINLYYLEIKKNDNVNNNIDEDAGNFNNSMQLTGFSRSQIVKNEESIREGELLKFSFKNKKFESRTVVLDKEKLIITNSKDKGIQYY